MTEIKFGMFQEALYLLTKTIIQRTEDGPVVEVSPGSSITFDGETIEIVSMQEVVSKKPGHCDLVVTAKDGRQFKFTSYEFKSSNRTMTPETVPISIDFKCDGGSDAL